jgi:hypothetical protein
MSLENDLNTSQSKKTAEASFQSSRSSYQDTRQQTSSTLGDSTRFNQVETSFEEDKTSKFMRRLLFGGFVIMFFVYLGTKDSDGEIFVLENNPPAVMAPPAPPVFPEQARAELTEKITQELAANGVVNNEEIAAAVEQALREAELAITEAATQTSILREFTDGIRDGVNSARYDDELLSGMGTWMEEMGYTGLSKEDLINLRDKGVTATYTNGIRELGYTDISLEDVVRLQDADVSVRFAAMMQSLNYNLTVDDMVRLRRADVTAFYTSNLHDLGYRDITIDQLIRFKQVGVTTNDIKKLMRDNNGDRPAIEDVLRYKISNQ